MAGPDQNLVGSSLEWTPDLDTITRTVPAVDGFGAQDLRYRLKPTLTLVSAHPAGSSETTEKFLYVSLEDSDVLVTPMTEDADDKRGYYTEQVVVSMSLEDCRLRQDKPDTTLMSGSQSEGTDQSISLGLFAKDPNGSVSLGHNSSTTTSLQDFTFLNRSDAVVAHTYRLGLVAGATYNSPTDLVGSVFDRCALHQLPPRASTSLPLVSKALFSCRADLGKMRKLSVKLEHHVVLVEKTFRPAEAAAAPLGAPIVGWLAGLSLALESGVSRVTHRNAETVEEGNAVVNVYRKVIEVSFDIPVDFAQV